MMWRSSTFTSSSLLAISLFRLSTGTLSKAALVGANKVKGPAAARRSIMPAAFSAVCSVEKCSFSAIRAAGWGAAGAGAGRGCLVGAWGSRLGLGRRKLGPGRVGEARLVRRQREGVEAHGPAGWQRLPRPGGGGGGGGGGGVGHAGGRRAWP